jgi:hypothetical protein
MVGNIPTPTGFRGRVAIVNYLSRRQYRVGEPRSLIWQHRLGLIGSIRQYVRTAENSCVRNRLSLSCEDNPLYVCLSIKWVFKAGRWSCVNGHHTSRLGDRPRNVSNSASLWLPTRPWDADQEGAARDISRVATLIRMLSLVERVLVYIKGQRPPPKSK